MTEPEHANEPSADADCWIWRTIAKPADDVTDALCLIIELWSDRCAIGFLRGALDVCERHAMTPDQERRLARHRRRIVQALPWAMPMRRVPNGEGSPEPEFYTHVSIDRCYRPGWIEGRWH